MNEPLIPLTSDVLDALNDLPQPLRTCVAQRLASPMTERVYVVLSSQIAAELERWLLAQNTRLEWEDLGHLTIDDMHDFERLESVLCALAQVVGQRYESGMPVTPLLEAVLARLGETDG